MSEIKITHVDVEKSSNIRSYGYHPESKTLEVTFKSGGTYRYADVPKHVYDAFSSADSKGTFLHNVIKGRYEHTKMV